MPTTDVAADIEQQVDELETLGPHPVFDALLSWQPEGGYLRELFGLGHLDDLALEPDEIHDPLSTRLVTMAGLISATPTGSIRVGEMQLVTDYYGGPE
jgi:hypothetical protein